MKMKYNNYFFSHILIYQTSMVWVSILITICFKYTLHKINNIYAVFNFFLQQTKIYIITEKYEIMCSKDYASNNNYFKCNL